MRVVDDIDHAEEEIIAAARPGLAHLNAVTLECVRDETSRDIHMLQLMIISHISHYLWSRTFDSISPSQPHLPAAEPFVAVILSRQLEPIVSMWGEKLPPNCRQVYQLA